MEAIGLFGGTFDPIHCGHLRTALEVAKVVGLSEVRFLPWPTHALRTTPSVGGALRVDMVRAAVSCHQIFKTDDRAFSREPPVYTYDVLSEIRNEHPLLSLCFLSGMDSFARMDKWHRWREILDLVHIVVARRPGSDLPRSGAVYDLVQERGVETPAALRTAKSGHIFVAPVTPLQISATALRQSIKAGVDPRFLVPEPVRQIILEQSCYGG
ncbi:nicotinate-nucleotide adenylyltransferase [Steroidobacter cummioxidans]|uniref:nicotinate-nucleotide adenylyltransferase n=1 Tax=Steroidobacter cummioxidans TaxID=1803913 RepID=UPI000E313037|nr:nicotinate-nucleotide adenylyltransferase [Steroidobacter cummioxidans]